MIAEYLNAALEEGDNNIALKTIRKSFNLKLNPKSLMDPHNKNHDYSIGNIK